MQMNTAQLLKESVGASREYEIDDDLSFTGEEIEKCHVKGDVKLIRTDRGILVRGNLESRGHLTCSRCLNLFEFPLQFKIEEEFFPTVDVNRGSILPIPDDSNAFIIDEHHLLDLSEAVRQYVLLHLPMKPLCRSDCGGLCPNCGTNINQGACRCNLNINK